MIDIAPSQLYILAFESPDMITILGIENGDVQTQRKILKSVGASFFEVRSLTLLHNLLRYSSFYHYL